MTNQKKRLPASDKITISNILFFPFLFLLILICMQHKPAIGQNTQDPNTTCSISSFTGRGDITFEILLYEDDSNTPLDGQTIVTYKDCNAIGPESLNPSPPWGEFPYGLWRTRIILKEFDPNIHTINIKIYFQGETNPLNSEYWSLDYDVNEKKIVWKEFKQGDDFSSNVSEDSIRIALLDTYLENGLGDRDPNQGVIDHLGGLLWPVPVGERCFINYSRSYGEGSREKIFLKHAPIMLNFLKSLDLFSSPI